MLKSDIRVMVPINVTVPAGLIAVCNKYAIPIYRLVVADEHSGWGVPGMPSISMSVSSEAVVKLDGSSCGSDALGNDAELKLSTPACLHRCVRIDLESGLESCDACGHVFRKPYPRPIVEHDV